MRICSRLSILLAISVVFVGCSDNGEGDGRASSEPLDVSSAADTPFCQAFADALESLDSTVRSGGENPSGGNQWSAELVQQAPPEIRADVKAWSGQMGIPTSWEEFFSQPEPVLEANQRVVAYVDANCSIDMDSVGDHFQQP